MTKRTLDAYHGLAAKAVDRGHRIDKLDAIAALSKFLHMKLTLRVGTPAELRDRAKPRRLRSDWHHSWEGVANHCTFLYRKHLLSAFVTQPGSHVDVALFCLRNGLICVEVAAYGRADRGAFVVLPDDAEGLMDAARIRGSQSAAMKEFWVG
jgi:hypothetical protein